MKALTNLMVLGWELISPKYHEWRWDYSEWKQYHVMIKEVVSGVTWLVPISCQ